jgi:hypothetical protein
MRRTARPTPRPLIEPLPPAPAKKGTGLCCPQPQSEPRYDMMAVCSYKRPLWEEGSGRS